MRKEDLMDFLNPAQQNSLKDYIFLESVTKLPIPIKKNDYIKFIYKYNYKFMEGGVVINTEEWPVILVKSYDTIKRTFYKIDLSQVYVFYKKSGIMTRRDYFEQLLENLEKKQLKKSS